MARPKQSTSAPKPAPKKPDLLKRAPVKKIPVKKSVEKQSKQSPAKTPTAKQPAPATTAQQLGSLIKSARDDMRKDKGLNGDLDRLPMLTWIMFLKFLDDLEQVRETQAVLSGKPFRPAIEKPYRWRDWAAKEGGITGEELIAFINNDEAIRPDGKLVSVNEPTSSPL